MLKYSVEYAPKPFSRGPWAIRNNQLNRVGSWYRYTNMREALRVRDRLNKHPRLSAW